MGDFHPGDLPVRLGPYTLLSLLGVGGMARVYRAIREGPMGFRKELAVKLIRAGDTPESRGLVKHLINEARLGGQLRHPNVVDTYEFGAVGDEHYIAMELVNGLTLRALLSGLAYRNSRIPFTAVLDLAMQVSQGLDYAHALTSPEGEPLNLIHRDLKPANIIVTMTGQAKIMDFGIARSEAALFKSTSVHTTKGTLKYMSPEQLSDPANMDHRSDLFSLGAIIFECVAGEQLVGATTPEAVMWNLVSGSYSNKLDMLDELQPELLPILTRCLEKERDGRYPGAGALREDLAELQLDLGDGFGCQELMSLHVAQANGETEELRRLQSKIEQRIERIGRDAGWTALLGRMGTARSGGSDPLMDSIQHAQGVVKGGTDEVAKGPPTELGDVTVVWQAEDTASVATAAAGDEGTTQPFSEFEGGGAALGSALGSALAVSAEGTRKPPPPPQGEPSLPAHAYPSEQQVVGISGEVSQSTMETHLPLGMAAAAAGFAKQRRSSRRVLAAGGAAIVVSILGVVGICAIVLAVWQPWRPGPAGTANTVPDEAVVSTPAEGSIVADEATAHPIGTAESEDTVAVHEEPVTPLTELVEPATPQVEVQALDPPVEPHAEESPVEEPPVVAPTTPVRVFVNSDPWASWTLTGSRSGSGDCPFIEELIPGTYHFHLKVPETGDTHTVTVQVQGDEGEIKRCWSFPKDGPC